jgi:hypothetical protein
MKVPKLTPQQKDQILGDPIPLGDVLHGYKPVFVMPHVKFCDGLYVKPHGHLVLLAYTSLRPVSVEEAFRWHANHSQLELMGEADAQVWFLKRVSALLPAV